MHILLPPSETKRPGGGGVCVTAQLTHDEILRETRILVRTALVSLCQDEDAAAKVLKLGVKNRGELRHNLRLESSGAMPAIERYTGVLYDALGVESLGEEARSWLDAHVSVQSALFGLVSAADPLPAYRLSASSRLPGLAAPLSRVWASAHSALSWETLGWVLDLRSKDYAALAPLPDSLGRRLHVAQRIDRGEVRALNHFNKAAKGDLVRRLAASRAVIGGPDDFLHWGRKAGLEVSEGPAPDEITLITGLGAPKGAAKR